MPCSGNVSSCSGIHSVPQNLTSSTSITVHPVAFAAFTAVDAAEVNVSVPNDPVRLEEPEVIVTMGLSLLAIVSNALVLFITKFTSGGQSPTMVFVRTLCVADFFVGCYGLGKTTMFFFVDGLLINFFLPECLLLTAVTAACLSLLFLNLERGLKVSAPIWYAQHVDKSSIITAMVFLWNVSFIVGFLPLLGWNNSKRGGGIMYDLFAFMPWAYLLLMGGLWVTCMAGSVVFLVLVRRRCHRLALLLQQLHFRQQGSERGGQPLTYHLSELDRYWRLRSSMIVDLIIWSLCFVPFLIFLGMACSVCPLGSSRVQRELPRNVYHFVPVFMLRSLAGAGIQLYRTLYVQGLGKMRHRYLSVSSSNFCLHGHHDNVNHGHHHQHLREPRENGLSAIAYHNPMSDTVQTELSLEDSRESFSSVPSVPVHHGADSNPYSNGDCNNSITSVDSDTHGFSNPAYRPSVDIDFHVTQNVEVHDVNCACGHSRTQSQSSCQAENISDRDWDGGITNLAYRPSVEINLRDSNHFRSRAGSQKQSESVSVDEQGPSGSETSSAFSTDSANYTEHLSPESKDALENMRNINDNFSRGNRDASDDECCVEMPDIYNPSCQFPVRHHFSEHRSSESKDALGNMQTLHIDGHLPNRGHPDASDDECYVELEGISNPSYQLEAREQSSEILQEENTVL